jgi:hypothetical protein
MAINFSKFGSPAAKAALESQANAPRQSEGSGDVGFGLFDFSNAPYPIKKWEPKKGKNLIMILPTEVSNPQNPSINSGAVRVGDYDYGISAFIHFGKGTVSGLSHVCLKRNYGKKCPRCDEFFLSPDNGGTFVKGVKGSGNQDHASSERNFFLVVPMLDESTPDTDNVGLWNSPASSRNGFPVVDRAKEMADGGPIIPFWWPTDEGRLVAFEVVKEDGGFAEYKSIKFIRRPTKLAADLAEKYSFALDTHLIVKDAEAINSDMFGGPDRSHKPAAKAQDDEAEAAKQAAYWGGAGQQEAAKETEVDADMSFPSLPPVPEVAKESDNPCPYGHTFGKDWQDHNDCKMCKRASKDSFTACSEAM